MTDTKGVHRPLNAYRVPAMFRNLSYKLTSALSSSEVPTLKKNDGSFSKATRTEDLFPTTDPKVDGDDCLHDCSACTVKYPRKFDIDETEELYGHVKGFQTHVLVATGKTDWVRDVADEKGSIMETIGKGETQPSNGKLMLSASDIPIPDHSDHSTMVLLLPAWQFIDNVTQQNTPELITDFVNVGPTNSTPFKNGPPLPAPLTNGAAEEHSSAEKATSSIPPAIPSSPALRARPCPHKYLILMCSQKTRDARCGQSAPLLRREFERILRPMGLYRDLHDERPGGVGIYFISHVGGHKFSANVMVYRHSSVVQKAIEGNGHVNGSANGHADVSLNGTKIEDSNGQEVLLDANKEQDADGTGEAAQCIWLARVRPEDCENIIRYTILQGKVVKPERQLRGGFDRCNQVASW